MSSRYIMGRISLTQGRLLAALLSVLISMVFVIQLTPTFSQSWTVGVGVLTLTLLSFVYGVVLLARPWQFDALGRDRSNTQRQERVWYASGIVLNVVLIVLFMAAHSSVLDGFGLGERFGHVSITVESFSAAMSALAIVFLVILARAGQPREAT